MKYLTFPCTLSQANNFLKIASKNGFKGKKMKVVKLKSGKYSVVTT